MTRTRPTSTSTPDPAPGTLGPHSSRVAAPTTVAGATHFDVLGNTLRTLCTDPGGLFVDGRQLGHGLPRRRIRLTELSSILMHPVTDFAARDEAWRLLVTRSRSHGPGWVVGAVGVALPGLRSLAHRFGPSRLVDVQAELLIGFVTALRTVDLAEDRVCPRLCNAALTAARTVLRGQEPATAGLPGGVPDSTAPPAPFGHPDFVLARAVAAAALSPEEADLIGATRLEDVSLTDYAARVGQTRWQVFKYRARAEARLAAVIASGWEADPDGDTIREATMTVDMDADLGVWRRSH